MITPTPAVLDERRHAVALVRALIADDHPGLDVLLEDVNPAGRELLYNVASLLVWSVAKPDGSASRADAVLAALVPPIDPGETV